MFGSVSLYKRYSTDIFTQKKGWDPAGFNREAITTQACPVPPSHGQCPDKVYRFAFLTLKYRGKVYSDQNQENAHGSKHSPVILSQLKVEKFIS